MPKRLDRAEAAFLNLLIGTSKLLPYRARVRFFGVLTGYVIAPLGGFIRKAMANLRFIYPDMPPAEARAIARKVAINAGRNLIESYSKDELAQTLRTSPPDGAGVADFHAAVAAGRPVLLVSGHFGNYETIRVALHNMGLESAALYRPASNPYFNRRYAASHEHLTGPAFAQDRRGILAFARYLREGGLAAILFDVRASRYGDVEFLGQPAPTSPFFAELALKTGALLLPTFTTRAKDGISHQVTFEAPIEHSTPEQMTLEMTRRLEARVRAHPEQWLWVHDRWGSAKLRARRAKEAQDETRHA